MLREGSPRVGPHRRIDDLQEVLEKALPQQTVTPLTYRGGTLWLALNPQDGPPAGTGVVLSRGTDELRQALHSWDPSYEVGNIRTESTISYLRERVTATPFSPSQVRVIRLADDLIRALRTSAFLGVWDSPRITSAALNRAVAALGEFSDDLPSSVAAVVEHVALSARTADSDCGPRLVRFVLALARETQQNLPEARLREWAESIEASLPLEDELPIFIVSNKQRRLRLIISLHDADDGQWPEAIESWLLLDNKPLSHERFQCEQGDTKEKLGFWTRGDFVDLHRCSSPAR